MSPPKKLTPLETVLHAFADVKAGEGFSVVLMFINIFMILTAYYILKTVREGLIIGGGGMMGLEGDELKIYASAGMAGLLLLVIPAYGALASRVDRLRLLNYSALAVIGSLVVFFVLGRSGVALGLAFFVWLGIVSVFLIAQFWSYANDIYSESQGKRLFAIIAIGGSLGGILGPRIAAVGAQYTYLLMLVAGVVIGICQVLYNVVNKRQAALSGQEQRGENEDAADAPLDKAGGFTLVFRQKYLLLIALLLLLANVVNTTGEYILSNAAKEHAAVEVPDTSHGDIQDSTERSAAIKADRTKAITAFYGNFFFVVNLLGFLIQAFAVSRIFKYLGVRAALFFLPVIAFGAYAAVSLIGGLAVLRIAKTLENSTDYSLQNTVRQALFLPTSREAKYKAKAAIDTFFVRSGDAIAAGVVAIGIHILSFEARTFAFVNMGLVALWILIAVGIVREHKKLVAE